MRPIYERGPIAYEGWFEFIPHRLERITPDAKWLALPPRGSRGGSGTVAAGVRTNRVAIAGPFLVEHLGVEERAPYPAGSVRLGWVSAGLPRPRVDFPGIWAPERQLFDLESAPSQSARHVPRAGFDGDRWINRGELAYQQSGHRIEGLYTDVDYLSLKNGAFLLNLPAEPLVREIRNLEPGAQARDGDRWVEIDALQLSDSSNSSWIDLALDGVSSRQTHFWALDKNGRRLDTLQFEHNRGVRLSIEGRPNRLTVLFRRDGESLKYSFAFPNTPLAKYKRQPEKLPELRFPKGEAPLRIRIVRIVRIVETQFGSMKVQYRLENLSNKDMVGASFSPVEMAGGDRPDWRGQEIRLYRNRSGSTSTWPDGHREILVRSGETASLDGTIFEKFELEEGVSALAVRVNFIDETNWEFVARR